MSGRDRPTGRTAVMPASFGSEEQRIWNGLIRALAEGEPVSYARAGEIARPSEAAVRHLLDEALDPGWRHLDAEGRVIGFGGLSLRPATPHQIAVEGRTLYTWCAWDTLFLPRILERPVDVRSVCPVTGRAIELHVAPDRLVHVAPSEAVMSLVPLSRVRMQGDVYDSFCRHVHFFASEAAGRRWLAENPDAALMGLDEGFELGREMVDRSCCAQPLDTHGTGQSCC